MNNKKWDNAITILCMWQTKSFQSHWECWGHKKTKKFLAMDRLWRLHSWSHPIPTLSLEGSLPSRNSINATPCLSLSPPPFGLSSLQAIHPQAYPGPAHSGLLPPSKPSPAPLFQQFCQGPPSSTTFSSTGKGQSPPAHRLTGCEFLVKPSAFGGRNSVC